MSAPPTQVRHPWRATVRTLVAIASALPVVVIVLELVRDEMGAYLSPEAMAWLAWLIGLLVAFSSLITRVMAIPAVNKLLTCVGLGAEPPSAGRHAG